MEFGRCFLVILAGRIIVDTYLMIYVTIKVRIFFRFEDIVDHRQFTNFFCLEVCRIIQYFAVAVS